MRPYHASNQAPFGSLILLLIAGVVAGAVVGGILWGVEHFTGFYLVVAFPAIAGAIAGGVLSLAVKSGKVRSPLLAGVFGLLTGVVMFGVYHFASYYVTFREQVRQVIVENASFIPTDQELDQLINDQLAIDVGDTGFVGYLKLAAQEGFSISRAASSSSSGLEIQGTLAWVYWGVEILIAGGVAAFAAGKQAGEPFDENAGAWYGPLTLLGKAPAKARAELVNALKHGDYEAAGRLLADQNLKGNLLDVGVRRSPDQAAQDIIIIVRQQGRNMNEVQRGVISPSELQRLTRAMETAAQTSVIS